MNKFLIFTTLTAAVLLTGCDKFKPKDKVENTDAAVAEWSCTNQDNLNNIQAALKKDYLKQIERSLRESQYQADYDVLDKINKGLKFEIKNVRTLDTAEGEQTSKTQLSCESQLIVQFPKGLQKRAENAYAEQQKNCEECEGDYSASTLGDYFADNEYSLTLEDDKLKGSFFYDITKTDKDGLVFNIPDQNAVIDGVVFMATKAVQYVAYLKENRLIEQSNEQAQQQYDAEESAQMGLAQKAMDIRKKELDAEKAQQVERLNQTWDKFSPEQKAQLQQDQSDWFEKRDVDCKVLAQKHVSDIPEKDLETYQKQSRYWNDAMRQQDQDMQYTKCFTQRTIERIVYLNNVN
ncbi:hypothetical protein GCM10025882_23810 [Acinetobacter gyllenbergii]|uniref:Lysozyme inhibitor LprI N-terminal domain-containing protein n=1 Tax=Acinetobacter gyllenbergii CIP 110306 = MTCC 11365 TaxID=1217657 RepID=A0A829HN42_9GAMM|nr:hypothetical protein [Acinetobacter gyllenbergii]EPF93426.1 hypothetical protein F957_00222 [Acinetobacter gyllenbergii CIP 110306 = MTCC 11365]EPH32450.1 hypothetical protein L293_1543 [Acinetobacter gyllenbergii CIP 110306 = MTCC 11365]ESK44971.1 hypothetical protein F987_01905 [Acinetobacter gyllenbergii NIPH 230]MCU4582626.1 DUF1311 domain-containing protein [Acinetobacter gyllenbergii]GMA11956.1 hypothetical protein GCM10025882_23810 [Acinetobacter gyllenbergii]